MTGPAPSATRTSRLVEVFARGKCNRARAVVALLTTMFAASAVHAQTSGVWHVGPVPEVRTMCHAGDSLLVGTSAGLYVVDLKTGSLVSRTIAGRALPSSSVRAIATRGDSVLVGTDAGLTLIAATGASVFTPHAPGALKRSPLARIRDISFGRGGDWFISTLGGGFGVVGPGRVRAITRRDSLLADDVYAVVERPDGARWIATSAGLCAWTDDTTFVSFQAGAGIPRGEVRQIVGEGRTTYLFVRNRGVFRFDGARATAVASPPGVALRDAYAISCGADGSLWAAGGSWIAVRRGEAWSRVPLAGPDAGESWRAVEADGSGAFVGSVGGVVLAVARGGVLRVQLPGGLPAPRAASIAVDGAGGAWFLSGGKAVRADAVSRQVVVEKSPLAAEAIAFSPAGAPVVAGRWTVRRFGDRSWVDLEPDVREPDPTFTAVAGGDHGDLWVGTRAGSLYHYDGELWLRVARADADHGGALLGILAADGAVWGRTSANVARSSDGRWQWPAGIDSTTLADVAVSPDGSWVAATPKGLRRLDRDLMRWQPITPERVVGAEPGEFGPVGAVTALAFDHGGRLFIGNDGGVGCASRDGLRWLRVEDGIDGIGVADLAADDHYLWIGFAQDGLSVVPLQLLR